MSELWRRLRFLLRRERFDRELEEEIRSHLEMQAEENQADGMPAEEARFAARRQFGNVTALRERSRDAWGWRWLEPFVRDTRYALRTLRKSPGFAVVAVLTLALGLGANMTIFSLVYDVVLRPVRYREVGRLVDVHLILTEPFRGTIPMSWSYPKFEELRRRNRSFESLAAFRARDITLSGIDRPERLTGEIVSAQYFQMVGVSAVLGRVFLDEEDTPTGARPVILVSDGLWNRSFGRDPQVIGSIVRVEGVPTTIVGVLPPGFKGESGRTDVWAPMATYFMRSSRPGWREHNLHAIGRLRPGVSPQQADEDVRSLVAAMEREKPTDPAGTDRWSGGARLLVDARVDPAVREALWILQAATLFVLLIACVNLTNLLLGRGVARRRELAIRLALGTSRGAPVRQLLAEPVLLALGGGAAGLFLAACALKVLALILPEAEKSLRFDYTRLIDPESLQVELPLVILGILLSIGTGIVFGLLPAWLGTRADVGSALKSGPTAAGPRHRRLSNFVSPDYFQTIGQRLLAGRDFTARDRRGAPNVAIINQSMARHFFGNESAIGRKIDRWGGDNYDCEIIGVVRDAAHLSLKDPPQRVFYVPYAQSPPFVLNEVMILYVRGAATPRQVREVVAQLDKNVLVDIETLRTHVDGSITGERLLALLSGFLGALSLLLVTIGTYGVMAYSVTRRRNEIGVRIALGAQPPAVLSMVLREGLLLVLAGIAIGIPAALASTRVVASLLFGITARDTAAFAGATGVMALAALLATLLPARRAARIDPMEALRYE